jgi:hypothetical protein
MSRPNAPKSNSLACVVVAVGPTEADALPVLFVLVAVLSAGEAVRRPFT